MVDGSTLTPLRAAIIGLGNIAWKYDAGIDGSSLTHRSTYDADPRVELFAGCDPVASACEDFTRTTHRPAFGTIEALLEQRPDIVSICSPNHWHAAHLRACLVARVPMIWLEKPVTDDVEVARELLQLQRDLASSTVLVGFQRRYQPAYNRLMAAFADEKMGPCAGISITYSRGLETNGVHMLDMLCQLMGDAGHCQLLGVTPTEAKPASPSFLLRFADGVTCAVTGLQLDYHSIDITAHFARGRISVLYGGASELREHVIENPLYPGFYRLAQDIGTTSSSEELQADAQAVFPAMLQDLIQAHASGRDPVSSLDSALASQDLVDRVLAAAAGK